MVAFVAIGSGKSTSACLYTMYDVYVEIKATELSKYKRVPRRLKKTLDSRVRNRIKELKNEM